MEQNFNKLRGRIVEKYGTLGAFAEAMEWSMTTLSKHMNGKTGWTMRSIQKAVDLLNITVEEIGPFFYS